MNFQKSKELWQQQVIADPKLTPRAKIILVAISWHLNRNSRVAWPGFAKLMRVTGNSRSTVIRAVHAGEKLGHLRVIRRRNSATRNAPNRYETLLKRTSGLTPPSVTSDTPLVSPLTPCCSPRTIGHGQGFS